MSANDAKPIPKSTNGHAVDWSLLQLSSLGAVVLREKTTAEEWEKVQYRWSATAMTDPYAVAYPGSVDDVQAIVRFAVKENVRIAVKGGGHSTWQCNGVDDGLIIDMMRINSVKVADDKKSVVIGGGALWEHVFPITDSADVAVVGGGVGAVGVGGFLTGAGYSVLTGLYGLGCDNVIGAQVVLADSSVVRCDAQHEPELFWSIRGGSSNFGVVTEFIINAYPHPGPVLTGILVYDEPQLHAVWDVAKHYLATRQPSQSFVFMFSRDPRSGDPGVAICPYVPGASKEILARDPAFGGFFTKVKAKPDMSWIAPGFDGFAHGVDSVLLGGPRRKRAGTVLFEPQMFEDREMFDGTWALWKRLSEKLPGGRLMFEMHHADKTASYPPDHTAYHAAGRRRHYYTLLNVQYDDEAQDEAGANFIAELSAFLRKSHLRIFGRDLHLQGNSVEALDYEPPEQIYGDNLPRLIKNKERYDPHSVFNRWHIIPAAVPN